MELTRARAGGEIVPGETITLTLSFGRDDLVLEPDAGLVAIDGGSTPEPDGGVDVDAAPLDASADARAADAQPHATPIAPALLVAVAGLYLTGGWMLERLAGFLTAAVLAMPGRGG